MRALLSTIFVTLALTAGCAAPTDAADTASDDSALSESSPITLENFVNHPKIVKVREAVAALDPSTLTKTERCNGMRTKFTDAQGRIRILGLTFAEGFDEGRTTAYYDESGKRHFIFQRRVTYDDQSGTTPVWFHEHRAYFGADNIIWQVVREGSNPDLSSAPYRLPNGSWETMGPDFLDEPNLWYLEGCR